MAALLLARLLTRPDMPQALAHFLAWQQTELARASGAAAVFLLPGVLQTLAQVYKLGRRQQLLQLTPAVWQQLAALLDQDAASGLATNALARKLAVKLAQRVGLAMLPPQLAGWRYVQAAADLGSNLAGTASADATAVVTTPAADMASATAADAGAEEEELSEVPAEIEDVLGVLLSSCSDRDTVVRWSAAKGVARLASCLPQELAGEVAQGVLGLLSPSGARLGEELLWQGAGCSRDSGARPRQRTTTHFATPAVPCHNRARHLLARRLPGHRRARAPQHPVARPAAGRGVAAEGGACLRRTAGAPQRWRTRT
jgi:hypothetical protein